MTNHHSYIIKSLSYRTSNAGIAVINGTLVRNVKWRNIRGNDNGIFVRSNLGEYNRYGKGNIL